MALANYLRVASPSLLLRSYTVASKVASCSRRLPVRPFTLRMGTCAATTCGRRFAV